MYLRLPLRAGTVFVCLGMESHSRTALYQGGRIDVRLTYSLRHPGRRRAALSFLFCSSLSMIDFYRGSRSFFRKRVQRYDLFLNWQNIPGIFFEKMRFFLKNDGRGWELWELWERMGAMRDGWARLPAGAIDKRNKKKTSEKKNIRKEKHQKRKTSEKEKSRRLGRLYIYRMLGCLSFRQ